MLEEAPRAVPLPEGVAGALFLSSMPGRLERLDRAFRRLRRLRIDRIVCLTSIEEARAKSPRYAAALRNGGLPWPVRMFPIVDFGVPDDPDAFRSLVAEMREWLLAGERLLVHCAAGFGRTGSVATCALVAVGVEPDAARRAVFDAGGRPEHDLVDWLA